MDSLKSPDLSAVKADVVKNEKWVTLKHDIRETWPRVTDADLEATRGDLGKIETVLIQRHGLNSREVREQLDRLAADFRRDMKAEFERGQAPIEEERDGVRGTLHDQYRQF